MRTLIDSIDALPQVLKLVLALPGVDIVWWIYRICRSLEKNNLGGVIVAVLVLLIGVPFMWLIDIITVLMKNTVWWNEENEGTADRKRTNARIRLPRPKEKPEVSCGVQPQRKASGLFSLVKSGGGYANCRLFQRDLRLCTVCDAVSRDRDSGNVVTGGNVEHDLRHDLLQNRP